MATFIINCPGCGQAIEADDAWVGQSGACPKCGKMVSIDRPHPASAPPALRAASVPPPPFPASVGPGNAPTPGSAIASLVLGVLGMVCCGPLTGIPAIICGHLARRKIARSRGALNGASTALAGLILGYVSLASLIVIMPIMAALAIPAFVQARAAAGKKACVTNLRLLDHAKEQWSLETNQSAGAVPSTNDILPYCGNGGTKAMPVCPARGTYELNPVGTSPTCSVSRHALP